MKATLKKQATNKMKIARGGPRPAQENTIGRVGRRLLLGGLKKDGIRKRNAGERDERIILWTMRRKCRTLLLGVGRFSW